MRHIDKELMETMDEAIKGRKYLEKAYMPVHLWDADEQTLLDEIKNLQAEILRCSLVIAGCQRRLEGLSEK